MSITDPIICSLYSVEYVDVNVLESLLEIKRKCFYMLVKWIMFVHRCIVDLVTGMCFTWMYFNVKVNDHTIGFTKVSRS